jgi:hypothetical protein
MTLPSSALLQTAGAAATLIEPPQSNGRPTCVDLTEEQMIALLALRRLTAGTLVEIMAEITRRNGPIVKMGGLYRTITELCTVGFIGSRRLNGSNIGGRKTSNAFYWLTDEDETIVWESLQAYFPSR